jgi:hypothetical protein
MQRFESCRLELRVLAISILECRCSNPAAPTGQSVSNAYGIGSRSKCRDMADISRIPLGLCVRKLAMEAGFGCPVSRAIFWCLVLPPPKSGCQRRIEPTKHRLGRKPRRRSTAKDLAACVPAPGRPRGKDRAAESLARVAVLYNPDTAPYAGTFLRTIEAAAPSFRIEPSTATARNAAEIEGAIAAIAREPGGGVVQIPDSFTLAHREPIVRVIAHHRLPAVYSNNSHQVRSGHQPQGALGLTVPSPSPPKDLCGSPQARSSPTDRSSIFTLSCDRLPTVPLESDRDLQCQYASSSRRIIRLGQTRSPP